MGTGVPGTRCNGGTTSCLSCVENALHFGLVNTLNSVTIVDIANIVDFNALRYKKQYNDSPKVLVTRQNGNSMERDNFSAIHLSNSYSWNYKLFLNFFCVEKRRE